MWPPPPGNIPSKMNLTFVENMNMISVCSNNFIQPKKFKNLSAEFKHTTNLLLNLSVFIHKKLKGLTKKV